MLVLKLSFEGMYPMWQIVKPFLIWGSITVTTGCVVVGDNPTVSQTSQGARNFAQIGTAAGEACIAQITETGNPASILSRAGYSKGLTTRHHQYYVRSLDGGKRSIGGKDMGGTSIGLPIVAERSGRKKCTVSVGGFSKVDGDIFFRAFQAAGRGSSIGPRLRFWGRYEHGRSNMGMAY